MPQLSSIDTMSWNVDPNRPCMYIYICKNEPYVYPTSHGQRKKHVYMYIYTHMCTLVVRLYIYMESEYIYIHLHVLSTYQMHIYI